MISERPHQLERIFLNIDAERQLTPDSFQKLKELCDPDEVDAVISAVRFLDAFALRGRVFHFSRVVQ